MVRQLCVLLDAQSIYLALASVLGGGEQQDLEFVAMMVQVSGHVTINPTCMPAAPGHWLSGAGWMCMCVCVTPHACMLGVWLDAEPDPADGHRALGTQGHPQGSIATTTTARRQQQQQQAAGEAG